MNASHWLMIANIAIWIGIGSYTAFLASAQKDLSRRIAALEQNNER